MIPAELLPFYTHLGKEDSSLDTTYNLYSLSNVERYRALDFSQEEEVEIKYKVGGSADSYITSKPYSIEYGINKLTSSSNITGSVSLTNFTNPVYTEASGCALEVLTPEDPSILNRIGDLEVTVNASFNSDTFYIGPIVNEIREVIYANDPIYLGIDGLLFVHYIKSEDGLTTYQPGLDYYFNAETQQITRIDLPAYLDPLDEQQLDATAISLGQRLLIQVSYIKNITQLTERSSGGTFTVSPSPAYGIAFKDNPGATVNYNVTVNWNAILDTKKADSNYVLLLNNSSGSHTLASSASDNIEITQTVIKRLEAKDFKSKLGLSHPVLLNSRVSTTQPVSYSTYIVDNLDSLTQFIDVEYDYTDVDNPVKLESQTYRTNDNINGIFKGLPLSKAVINFGSYSTELEELNEVARLQVPPFDGGLLTANRIDQDMSFISPESAGWGLLISTSLKDIHLTVLQLKEFARLAKAFSWTEDNAGLGLQFSPYYAYENSGEKDILQNAFLGFAICAALDYVTSSDELMGNEAINELITQVLDSLYYLAKFVANSANQTSWLCAESYVSGYYSYETESQAATLFADYFLSYFISFRYDQFCHYIAARLDHEAVDLELLPDRFKSLNELLFSDTALVPPVSSPTDFIDAIALDKIYTSNYKLDKSFLDVGGIEAMASSLATLAELRRMMPFGLRWFSEENVNRVSSIIGSILYSEAEIYYQYALFLYVIVNKQSPTQAKFEDASNWFSYMFNTKVIGSAARLSNLISLFTNYEYQNTLAYKSLVEGYFSKSTTLTYKLVPDFYIYDFDTFSVNNPITYKLNPRTIDLSDPSLQLTRDEFLSITFKYEAGRWVERQVPGLPIPNVTVPTGFIAVEAYQYLNSPRDNMLVIDDDMLIYPINNYFMNVELELDKIPFFLNTLDNFAVPAGVIISYKNTVEMVGD